MMSESLRLTGAKGVLISTCCETLFGFMAGVSFLEGTRMSESRIHLVEERVDRRIHKLQECEAKLSYERRYFGMVLA